LVHDVPAPQTVPQAPQLLLSVLGLTQVLLQTISPPAHRQIPCWQFAPFWQTLPHEPQLWASVFRLTQVVPHRVVPLGQPVQTPPAQVWPGKQA
jgi:hypothetical protein